ncbi:TPA: oxidoreductase, partial [Klebsiella pneumoniae]
YMLIRDALKGQIANPVPPVEALAVMAVLEAAVRSAESGMVQTLDLSDDERNTLR